MDQKEHQRYISKIKCVFYKDVLANGSKSPGVVLSTPKENRSVAYVVEASVWNNRYDKKNVSRNYWIEDDLTTHVSFAEEHVLAVKFDSKGMSINKIMDDYDIIVDYPFSMAIYGELVEKSGLPEGGGVVPDGLSEEEIKNKLSTDPKVDIYDKMRYAREKYKSNKQDKNGKMYPEDGDIWK